jgi:hypothetical protein
MKPLMKKLLPIILALITTNVLSKKDASMSPLDSAYAVAKDDKSKKVLYYEAFINTEIYVPTHDSSEKESFAPMYIETNGVNYLVLFDSKQRLTKWAKTEMDFVELLGHEIVEKMSADFHWVLNPNTKHVKTFNPDEIKWLKQTVAQAKSEQSKLPKGTNVLIGVPPVIPEGLIDSLINTLSKVDGIKRAYLGQVFYQEIDEKPHLALVLQSNDVSDVAMRELRSDIVIATKGLLGESKYLDIMLAGESGLADEIIQEIEAFYVVRK